MKFRPINLKPEGVEKANKCQLRLKALLASRRNNHKVIQVVNYIRDAFQGHHTSNRTGYQSGEIYWVHFKTKTKQIVFKESVGSIEGPAEALKCAMQRKNENPAIGGFNVNGGKETTRTKTLLPGGMRAMASSIVL